MLPGDDSAFPCSCKRHPVTEGSTPTYVKVGNPAWRMTFGRRDKSSHLFEQDCGSVLLSLGTRDGRCYTQDTIWCAHRHSEDDLPNSHQVVQEMERRSNQLTSVEWGTIQKDGHFLPTKTWEKDEFTTAAFKTFLEEKMEWCRTRHNDVLGPPSQQSTIQDPTTQQSAGHSQRVCSAILRHLGGCFGRSVTGTENASD